MPYIQYQDELKYRYFNLPEDKMSIFGREEQCDFQMEMDALISREHFGIEKDEDGKWIIIDLGSTNCTFLNGRKLSNETVVLEDGDKIRAGSQNFVFYEEMPEWKTQDLFNEVADSISQGKGFRTVMSEVIGKKV